jgi:Ca2+-binding EF-hand superfamily protein
MLRTPSRYTRSGEARQDPAKLFARFDKDSSGALDLQEFMAAVRKGGRIGASVIADRAIRWMFRSIDADGSGRCGFLLMRRARCLPATAPQ